MYGLADGLRTKEFANYTDGDVESKLNKFFKENPKIIVLDIKYTNTYHHDYEMYGTEKALLIYRKA
ncbi:hypothetical protein [Lysinibacillus sp. FSL K6-0102]|uniref:hypothetical protein n=1 Tax=Lysinibacillus sp. FSL K6-0102 TaxID=2975290 RepID=UPI0030FC76EC